MLQHLDALVEAQIFKSRSESAAFLIAEGIKRNAGIYEKVAAKISEIQRLRQDLKEMVGREAARALEEPEGS